MTTSVQKHNGTVLQMSSRGVTFLKAIEKLRLKPYDDQTGKEIMAWCAGATIGYGHLIARHEWARFKKGIDQATANNLFMTDLSPFVRAVSAKVNVPLSQNQFDALVTFAFNVGVEAFSSSSVLKLVNNPSAATVHSGLEAAWKAWNKSQGKVNAGLVKRREAEWKMYSANIYQGW